MISAFLRSLAALIRQLIADGKAVYVTEQTPKEMELLAGLPWVECKWAGSIIQGGVSLDIMIEQAITPADLALGWLLASKARQVFCQLDADEGVASGVDCDQGDYIDRAAVCAELAVIAVTAPGPWYLLSDSASMHTRGTREGALAAWEFMAAQLWRQTPPIGFPGNKEQCARDKTFRALRDLYHREAEAMK